MTLFGGHSVPSRRLFMILVNTAAFFVHKSEIVLG